MGLKLKVLAKTEIPAKTIFNNRFVVEVCEKIHTHYRNLRIIQNMTDWEQMSKGMADAYNRWKKLGEPPIGKRHLELCRKPVALFPLTDNITISLNKNLYGPNEDKIFSEGAEFTEPEYIHVKYRDLRLEMPISEFKLFSDAMTKAKDELCRQQS